jgi:5-methylcytosine-specific restriction enzyme subunit McrC
MPLRRRILQIEGFKTCDVSADDVLAGGKLDVYSQLHGKDLFKIELTQNGFRLCARGHLGLIPVNDKIAIEVTPRVPLKNLEQMMLYNEQSTPIVLDLMEVSYRDNPLRSVSVTDLFASQLVELCSRIRDEGLFREYRPYSGTTASPRGRIRPRETALARARTNNPAVAAWTAFDRTRDNAPNQVIRLALQMLRDQYTGMRERTGARAIASRLTQADMVFQHVALPNRSVLQEPLVKLTKLIPEARRSTRIATELAKTIVQGRGIEIRSRDGAQELPTFLISMSYLFEDFVRGVLRAEFHARGQFSVLDGNHGGDMGARRAFFSSVHGAAGDADRDATPDIVISDAAGTSLIVGDVKYKPYGNGPKREDVDQVLAYSVVYGCKDALLIYPASKPSAANFLEYGTVRDVKVHVLVLDLDASNLLQETRAKAALVHGFAAQKFPQALAA